MSKDDDEAAKRWQAQVLREHRDRQAKQAAAAVKPTAAQLYDERAADLASGRLHGERRGRSSSFRKPIELVVVRDSVDLGLDKGMRCRVVRVKGQKMDIHCNAIGATISGVAVDHPDLRPV